MRGLGYPMHAELAARARFAGEARIRGRLLSLGWYPGLIAGDGWVLGEVYDSSDEPELLSILDRYEGCAEDNPQPHEYRRVQRSVQLLSTEESIVAWTYEYCGAIAEQHLIPRGDFRAFVKGNSKSGD